MISIAILSVVVFLLIVHIIGVMLLRRNQRWMLWPPSQRTAPTGDKTVAVIVPARNESADVSVCIESLLAQDYPLLKIVAVNDHSDDGTGEILDRIAQNADRLTVIHDPLLRPGWLGKHNAMQTALETIDADYVLLTDADVRFQPGCVSDAVAELQTKSLDMLSLLPQCSFVTFCETMLVPIYVSAAVLMLSPSIEDPKSKHAMAAGAFILVRSERLREVAGFETIRREILDDVRLAMLFKKRGFRIGVRSAPDLMHVRLFKSNRHAFFGVTKHLLGLVQDTIWLAPVVAVAPALIYGTLLFAVGYGLANQHFVIALLAFATLAIHYGALLMTRPEQQFNPIIALAFPCMAIQLAASCLRAVYLLVVKDTFSWRGRDTNLGAEQEHDS